MSKCTIGHDMIPGERFCATCGSPAQGEADAGAVLPPVEGTPAAPAAQPGSRRNLIIAAVVGVLVLGVVLLGQGAGAPKKSVEFSLSVYDDGGCELGWGYANVPGLNVELYIDGEFFSSSNLSAYGDEIYGVSCTFSTTFSEVPSDGELYVFKSDRGDLSYTKDDLVEYEWSVNPTLGL